MSFKIEFDTATEVISITYTGKVTLNARIQAVKEVTDRYVTSAPLKIVIDVRALKMHLTLDEQKSFGEYLASHEGLRNAKVAVLHPSDHNPNLVIDIHAFTNGYRLAEFEDLQEAQGWLLET